ncbi:hypothetical protein NC651_039879 [Populus alba x Populus x berolinensis]|nr:hypothetical protein NC651_039879 [Populus alba x Populus x berolinensis]
MDNPHVGKVEISKLHSAAAQALLLQQCQPIPTQHARGSYRWGENLTLMSSYQACKRKQRAAKAIPVRTGPIHQQAKPHPQIVATSNQLMDAYQTEACRSHHVPS